MKEEIPFDLIVKNLAAESTPEEDIRLWEWIERDAENQKIFSEAIDLYSGRGFMISTEEVQRRLGRIYLQRLQRPAIHWKVAASLTLICVFAAAIILLNVNHVVEQTSFGVTKRVTLPDGSHVWLNGGTKLTYNKFNFPERRKVSVEGEAYFEVLGGIAPFMIEYDSIQVLLDSGEVNVQTYPHELEKIVVVNKGTATFHDLRKVSVEITASTDHEILSRSDYGLLAKSINSNVNFRSWVTGVYVFNDEPISRVVSIFGGGNPNFETNLADADRDRLISGIFQIDRKQKSNEEILRLLDSQTIFWK